MGGGRMKRRSRRRCWKVYLKGGITEHKSYTGHMMYTCWSHASHMMSTCWSHDGYMLVT